MATAVRIMGSVIMVLALLAAPVRAQNTYMLDPGFARVGFSVSHLGLFHSDGTFKQFQSQLLIDPAHPERTEITVDIGTASVNMSTEEGETMLRSPAFLDVVAYPVIRFRSVSVTVLDPAHFRINGHLEVRGITKDVALDATLANRQRSGAAEMVDFHVSSTVNRLDYGMLANRDFISDNVTLDIRARLLLNATDGQH